MDYSETLDYLYSRLPMYHRIGAAAFKKDLTNTLALCEYLGNPHLKFKSVHVGGTNGKGSVSHMLSAVCQAAGLKTGLYVSPHYKDFRERIKINGRYISRGRVVEFVENNREAIERIQPSFFELCVAMAFDHFAREKVDVAIIEVGLGGRLDSTNVITPELSVITNISYDHMNMLGDTLPLIAGEKAGIIKPGIPVVIGETHPESAPVFLARSESVGAPIVFADQHFQAQEVLAINWQHTSYRIYRDQKVVFEDLELAASGPFQTKNLCTLLQAVEALNERPAFHQKFQESELRHALQNLPQLTRFMGRWQVIGQHPTILCDSAHNEGGLRVAFERVQTIMAENRRSGESRLHIVTGFVNDKDVDKALELFPTEAQYYFAKANIPRGLEASVLQEKAASFRLQGKCYSSVKNALKAAKRHAAPQDLILVIGSIFVVAEVL